MNKPTIDPVLIGRHRAVLETWNLLGKCLFTVKAEPADLMWNDLVRKDDPTRTIKPIMKYMIEVINITSVNTVPLPDGSTLVIELNGDPSLQFKLSPAKFADVTMEKITEALENAKEQKIGREPIFFRDCITLTEQVNRLNALEASKAEDIAERMLGISKLLTDLNKEQNDSCSRYYEELGCSNS